MTTNPRRFVRMFKPTFAPLVEKGSKLQTVRPTPRRMPRAGDIIDAREWTGKPYRSKQRKLIEAPIWKVSRIYIERGCIVLGDDAIGAAKAQAFALADGFDSAEHFYAWFEHQHGLPFEGIVITWK